jgi:ATP/maltotriose-dependent transcriptional regulator MalT
MLQRTPDVGPTEQTELYERLGQVRVVLNQMEASSDAFEQMVQSARTGDDSGAEGRGLLWLSFVQTRLSHMSEARALGSSAVEVASRIGDPRVLAGGYWNLGRLHLASGDLDPGAHLLDDAEQIARSDGDDGLLSRCLMDLARLSIWRGEYERAEQRASEGLARARAGRDGHFLAGIAWTLGIARGEMGHYSQALDALRQGLSYTAEADDRHYPVKLLNTMGWLHGEIGDHETALRYDLQALEAARQGPADPVREAECYCLLNLATDSLAMGDADAAERYLAEFDAADRGVEYTRFRYLNRSTLVRAQLALARDDPNQALRLAHEAEDLAAEKGMRKNIAKSSMLTGEALIALARPQEAVDVLSRAVSLADELRHGSLRWQSRILLARAQILARRYREATVTAGVARSHAETVASNLVDERQRQTFAEWSLVKELSALAGSVERPVDETSYPAGLTAREVEVLRLVARGETNKDIALSLHISVKTVNAHLNSIFTKVDCRTRAAATAFAFTHGLA